MPWTEETRMIKGGPFYAEMPLRAAAWRAGSSGRAGNRPFFML